MELPENSLNQSSTEQSTDDCLRNVVESQNMKQSLSFLTGK